MNLSRILVVADRHDPRQLAVRAAIDLTRGLPAEIVVVGFVYDALVEQPHLVSKAAARRLMSAIASFKQHWLSDALARLPVDGVKLTIRAVWARDVAAWVLENAGGGGYDLVVKTGSRSEKLLYTPTDWRLLRESPVPVMIVSGRLRKQPGRVLAALDLDSRRAVQIALNSRVLQSAAEIAARLGAEVYVIYAVAVSTLAKDLDLVSLPTLERKSAASVKRYVAELAAKFKIPVHRFHIKAGPPDRVIAGAANKLKASLVVMGTIGRKGVKRRFLGNTAEEVLHRNRANVLALKPGQ